MISRSTLFFITLLLLLLFVGCGGSDSVTAKPDIVPPPLPTPTPTNTSGVITSFGSVFINGVKYETDETDVSTDDNDNASESDLQVGMVVSLTGEVNDDGQTGNATSIHYEEQIKGPLTSIDLAANRFIILGQSIIYDDLTSLDNVILAELIPGDFLEVSGFYNADNELYATRIEKEDQLSQVKIEGEVSLLDTSAKTFMLGELTINYATAEFTNFSEDELANEQTVRVKGDISAIIDTGFTITEIKLKQEEQEHQEGDNRNLEGIITSFESSSSFIVNGVHVITDENTEFEHGSIDSLVLNIRVKIKGSYNEQASLVAHEIRVHQRTNLTLEGSIQAIDLDEKTLTVLDTTFTVNEQTKMKDKSDNAERFFDLSYLAISDYVEVKGFIDSDGSYIASKLTRENEDDNNEIEIKGTVSNIIDFSFDVLEITINTTSSTIFENTAGDKVSQADFFAELTEGVLVEVKGILENDEFIADKVEIKESDEDKHRTEFRGIIEELQEQSLVVSQHLVNVNENTKFEVNDEDVSAEQFWQLANVGDQIKIKGEIDENGTITAKSIELELEHQQGVGEIKLSGQATYQNDVLTLLKHIIIFDDNTEIKGENNSLSLSEFIAQVPQWPGMEVKGVLREETIFAHKIEMSDDTDHFGEIKLEAVVETVNDNGFTLAGHTVLFTDDTEFKAQELAVTKNEFISQLSENILVEIEGVVNFSENNDGTLDEAIAAKEAKIK